MTINNLIDYLEKRISILQKKVDFFKNKDDKNSYLLSSHYGKELENTKRTYNLISKLIIDIDPNIIKEKIYIIPENIKEKLPKTIVFQLPRLSFKLSDKKIKSQIESVVKDTLEKYLINADEIKR